MQVSSPCLILWAKNEGLQWSKSSKRWLIFALYRTWVLEIPCRSTGLAPKMIWLGRWALFWLIHRTSYEEPGRVSCRVRCVWKSIMQSTMCLEKYHAEYDEFEKVWRRVRCAQFERLEERDQGVGRCHEAGSTCAPILLRSTIGTLVLGSCIGTKKREPVLGGIRAMVGLRATKSSM